MLVTPPGASEKHLSSTFLSMFLPFNTRTGNFCLLLPLPEEVADGGVLCGQCAGQEWHQASEALPQLLHVLLQGVDVRVQLPSAALHL